MTFPVPAAEPAPVLPEGTTVKVIGLGGVGGVCARYALLFLAHLDVDLRVVLIDGDAFDQGNMARMSFSSLGNKAEILSQDLLPLVEDSRITIVPIGEYVTPENVGRLVKDGDIVLMAVDNHATRKLVNDHCVSALSDVCLISGGNDGVGEDGAGRVLRGTFGNVQIFLRQLGEDRTPALDRYHREIRDPADRLPSNMSCGELVKSVPQLLFTNLMTAAAMLNCLALHLNGSLSFAELTFDVQEGLMRPVAGLPIQFTGDSERV